MSNLNAPGLQTLQPAGQAKETGLVQVSFNTPSVSGLSASAPGASTAVIAISSGNQTSLRFGNSTDAFISNGGEVFLLICFALIGMVAIVRRQRV